MANLITMAGLGKRFSNEGYKIPKALISTSGKPMIHKVIESLPKSDKWVFILRQEHVDNFAMDKVIKQVLPNAIITIDKELSGQASIFCAEKYLDKNEEVFIAGCDCGFLYNNKKHDKIKLDKNYDFIMWTFTEEQRLRDKPESWGYVVLGEDKKTITNMSVKVPISKDPYYDHVVTAAFWISSSKLLFDAVREMMKKEIKTNGEYYLDNLPIALNLLHKKSTYFDVDLYVGWGTPKELHDYEEIQFFYKYSDIKKLTGITEEKKKFWKKYFDKFEK